MANRKFWIGMLVIVLVFGMTVVGCDNGTSNDGRYFDQNDENGGKGNGNNNGGNDGGNIKVNWRNELTPTLSGGYRTGHWINGTGFDMKILSFVTDNLGYSFMMTQSYSSDHLSILQYSFELISKDDKPSGQTSYFTIKQEGGSQEMQVSYSVSGSNLYIYGGLNTYPVYFPSGTYVKN